MEPVPRPPPAWVGMPGTTEMSSSRLTAEQYYELQPIDSQVERESCKRRMIASGWCHHRAKYLANTYNLRTLTYISALEYVRDQKHNMCRNTPSCIAYTVNNSTYQTRHVDPDCTCGFVETPFEDLKRVAEAGSVPLIEIERDDNTHAYNLRVRKRKLDSRYVAISHVWIDGLGNPSRCALPTCQVERLYKLIQKVFLLPGLGKEKTKQIPVLLWMDTLCIPPSDPAIKIAQIDKMASIYKGAATCLILDAELMALALEAFEDNGKLKFTLAMWARVVCSAWNSRSWTLQEGNLPPHCTVVFASNAILVLRGEAQPAVDDATERDYILAQEPESQSEGGIRDGLRARWTYVGDAIIDSLNAGGFAGVWNELAGRTTSQPEDIPLIIANLLDLRVGDLLSYDTPEQKFQAILLGLKKIPTSVFSNIGPRYHHRTGKSGNDWIPTAIGSEPLRERPLVYSFPPILRSNAYKSDTDMNDWFTLHTPILPLPRYLKFPHDSLKYSVEPPDLYLDAADSESNVETCIILDPPDTEYTTNLAGSTVRRGSCFSVLDRGFADTTISFRMSIEPRDNSRVGASEERPHFKISYDLLPGVKRPLQRHWRITKLAPIWFKVGFLLVWASGPITGATMFARKMVGFVKVDFIFVLWLLGAVVAFVSAGSIILWCFKPLTTKFLDPLYAWLETRAYERINRRSKPLGAVSGGGV